MAIASILVIALALVAWMSSIARSDEPTPTPAAPTEWAPSTLAPTFQGTIAELTDKQKRWMTGETWHKGCPTALRQLRLLHVSSYDFNGNIVIGRVVVNSKVAQDIVDVFRSLYRDGFQIEQLDTRELYPPDKRPDLSNPSVAFNCRKIAGSTSWSQHAYGLALDLNPIQNPWVKGSDVVPNAGKDYLDRTLGLPGMIVRGDSTVAAFTDIGWGWGGKWSSLKDYMHFSLTGG